jgi:DNA-binding HxlR family transcriptional regulator
MNQMIKANITSKAKNYCQISSAAEVIADHWSVIILRDIVFCNQRTFNSILMNNNESISSATLAKRLKRMCDLELLSSFDDPTHSQRKIYSLTSKGMDLIPIIVEMFRFGVKHASPSPTAILLPENKKRPLSSYEEGLFEELRLTHLNLAENMI